MRFNINHPETYAIFSFFIKKIVAQNFENFDKKLKILEIFEKKIFPKTYILIEMTISTTKNQTCNGFLILDLVQF